MNKFEELTEKMRKMTDEDVELVFSKIHEWDEELFEEIYDIITESI